MMQKPWFKTFIWFISSAFFFFASGVLISSLGPEPSQQQVMNFMSGMMKAMDKSMMGLSMSLEHDSKSKSLIGIASTLAVPLIILAIIFGLFLRLRRKKDAG